MRIGIIGTENSHTDYYLRCLNQENRHPGHRVTALVGGASERNLELARTAASTAAASASGAPVLGDIALFDSPADLIGHVDAAIVCSRDGRRHRAEATPLLDAGLPVFVDKPLACGIADAKAILASAHHADVPVTSYSSLRWLPLVTGLADRIAGAASPEKPAPTRLEISGPADPESPYAGIWFYGIHIVEIALALLPGRAVTDIAVRTAPGQVFVTAQAGATELSLTFLRPGPEGLPPWRLSLDTAGGTEQHEITLDPDYGAPGVTQLVRMLETGRSPLSEPELLAPIEFLAEIAAALPEPARAAI